MFDWKSFVSGKQGGKRELARFLFMSAGQVKLMPQAAMLSLLSALLLICVQTFSVVCSPLQVFVADNFNFSVHIDNQTRVRDPVSRPSHRLYQLYSRTSAKHVQIVEKKISANGEDGDKYAQLIVEAADTFGSQVRIRGKETNYYLCMNHRGKLIGKRARNLNEDCVFIEKILENNYTALMSARYDGWYVGFTKKGRPRRGPQTLPNQQDVHFMKRPPPWQDPPHSVTARFTTVNKKSQQTVQDSRPS